MVYNMGMVKIEKCNEPQVWDEIIHDLHGHPLQLWGWGEVKAAHRWRVVRLLCLDDERVIGAAQVLIRRLPKPFGQFLYVPRGPLWSSDRHDEVLQAVAQYCKQQYKGVALSIEPDIEKLDVGQGWVQAKNTVLLPRTLILDLEKDEAQLQADMSKKTRQYIRKSTKDGVVYRKITQRSEIDACLEIYKQTAERAHFALHDDQYYYDVHEKMGDSSVIFGAYKDDVLLSFVWLAVSRTVAFELYGGMNDQGQQLRANYGLKWHAITTCKRWGVVRYDMNGLLNDGVSTFKQGFAQHENQLIGTYDYPLSPLYSVWTHGLPMAKRTVQRIKSLRK